jgi:hypothetical protein
MITSTMENITVTTPSDWPKISVLPATVVLGLVPIAHCEAGAALGYFSDQLVPWGRVLEKEIAKVFITECTTARQWSITWARWLQSTTWHLTREVSHYCHTATTDTVTIILNHPSDTSSRTWSTRMTDSLAFSWRMTVSMRMSHCCIHKRVASS